MSSAWICWECEAGRASRWKCPGQNQDLKFGGVIGLELSISALNALCLCVKCTNRSYDVGEITKEENGDGKLRTEFCRKSIFKGQKEEKLVNKEGVMGEEVGDSTGRHRRSRRGSRTGSGRPQMGRLEGLLLRTRINLMGTQGWDSQGIG